MFHFLRQLRRVRLVAISVTAMIRRTRRRPSHSPGLNVYTGVTLDHNLTHESDRHGGQTATFTVAAAGTAPLIPVAENGVNIAGATTASYATPATTVG
jgi:hypothetical protein